MVIEKFENWAESSGWSILRETDIVDQSVFSDRYSNIPEEWIAFITQYKDIVNDTEDTWFVTYSSDEVGDFSHDEFEKMSLEIAEDDSDWQSEIKEFWDNHFVIVMSVGNGYEYYAIDLTTYEIVRGCEPEFEEVEVVAASFSEFIDKVINEEIKL